ncbi:MAG: hypothetical protein RLZZ338_2951 [Cyanobacteriota bacterium]
MPMTVSQQYSLGFPRAAIETRSPEVIRQQFPRRALLPNKKDGLWQIESGVVRTLTWLEDGTIITLGLWGPGEMVGKMLSGCNPYQIECLGKVEANFIPKAECEHFEDVLLKHILQGEELTMIRANKKVDTMLYQLLNWLAKKFGCHVEKGQLINLSLTHQDIAELLGATRVTITRILNQLEQQGIIHRLKLHRIVLHDSEFWHYEI